MSGGLLFPLLRCKVSAFFWFLQIFLNIFSVAIHISLVIL